MTHVLEIVVPPTGEPIDSARLVNWVVQPGQAFGSDDILLEIETDKSIIEVPAGRAGTMLEHLVAVDGLLDADTPIARILVEGEAPGAVDADEEGAAAAAAAVVGASAGTVSREAVSPETTPHEQAPPERAQREQASSARSRAGGEARGGRRFVTPAARSLAGELGVAVESVAGTGPHGRVTRSDVERSAARRPARAGVAGGAGDAAVRGRMREAAVSTVHGETWVSVWESASAASRPTVVLVHGMFGDRSTWAAVAHALGRTGLRVLAMDLPCHGRSKSEKIELADIVDSVAEVIARQCAGPIILVGHSFGGAVAAKLALEPNLEIESLVLIAPVGMGTQIEQSFLDGMSYADSNEAMRRELSKLTVAGITPSGAYVDELREAIRSRRDRLVELCRRLSWNGVQQIDVVPDLAKLRCPVVLIQGRRDRIVPWQHALNAPPRAALHLLPEAGHMPQWEASALVADILLDVIAR